MTTRPKLLFNLTPPPSLTFPPPNTNTSKNKMSPLRPPPLLLLLLLAVATLSSVAALDSDVDAFLSSAASIKLDPSLEFENPILQRAFIALQSWKEAMLSDPTNFTANWVGPDVCSYNGIYCALTPAVPFAEPLMVIAGIDLNHADIAGHLPPELGLLGGNLALLHLNSNRFCGTVPATLAAMVVLHELDLSNNRLVGKFPSVIASLPVLKYLDLRFNEFEGPIPPAIFDMDLDAIFLNDNRFTGGLPSNLGNSPASVVVIANNHLGGCIPSSLGQMGDTLDQIILLNDNLTGCLPHQIGKLNDLTVFDVSFNVIAGGIPPTVGGMKSVEQLNVGHNQLTGVVPASACRLPNLQNFSYAFNFFSGEGPGCAALSGGSKVAEGEFNCIAGKAEQRPVQECSSVKPVDCRIFKCYTPPQPPANWGMASVRRAHPPPPPPLPSYSYPPVPVKSDQPAYQLLLPPPSPVYYNPSPSLDGHYEKPTLPSGPPSGPCPPPPETATLPAVDNPLPPSSIPYKVSLIITR